ncbi:NAD(P)-dependent alcohol dehydrogenase [Microbacterium sp. YY-01]|uniref:NAD(P)-dependent alcohol dehydrogenase n=1 Tax=Microbacterium sp. YY-01 TaxID=3421634 RepID=UPI003D179E96
MSSVFAFAAPSEGAPLERTTIERREPGSLDVVIDVAYAGICHSDIHTVRGDWGAQRYPLVPGHEIAGTVRAVGSEVTRFAVGDRVGVGCLVNSCGECTSCTVGDQQHCEKGATGTYGAIDRDGSVTQGGYSQQIVVTEDFVLRIPDAIALDRAAPLLCAGITTYSPLRHWNAGPGTRVAVVGLGGLGHMAVQIARAMGADVTVLSQTLAKAEDGLRLGAHRYLATSDPSTFRDNKRAFDLIINTVSAQIPVDDYLSLLDINGAMVCLGAPPEALSFDALRLINGRRSLAGSNIGGIAETQEMLDFCAEHNLASEIELIDADEINEAYRRVLASDVRFRFVIDAATLEQTNV